MTKTLDLGCGANPKNPHNCDEIYGIDFKSDKEKNILSADLSVEKIPFGDNFFDIVTAFDFIEHIPRVIYMPTKRFCFVELMNEIYRVLKPGGEFLSFTPAYPALEVFSDPTHVNVITEITFPSYFSGSCTASLYGFKGNFEIISQNWHDWQSWPIKVLPGFQSPGNTHLITRIRKK